MTEHASSCHEDQGTGALIVVHLCMTPHRRLPVGCSHSFIAQLSQAKHPTFIAVFVCLACMLLAVAVQHFPPCVVG